jgi:hypothetical protein
MSEFSAFYNAREKSGPSDRLDGQDLGGWKGGRAAAEPDARPRPRLRPGRAAALLSRPKGHVG